jgi:PleD family two-component response regulator
MVECPVWSHQPWLAGPAINSWALRTFQDRTVLLVDDDVLIGDMYRMALERAGYRVAVASDGRTGLDMVRSIRPVVIFLDIRMPLMDGLEVLRILGSAEATRNIPVIMLSNFDDARYVNESKRLGAKEYLVKAGIDPRDLAAVVARWWPAA